MHPGALRPEMGNIGNKKSNEQIDYVIQDTEGVVGISADKYIIDLTEREQG